MFPPIWSEVFGEDDSGIFAEFMLEGVSFVWRWIPPGRFLMGSPESEKGRYPDEGPQHQVTISQGFWMGETPVTQAQWVALMKENPSRFQENGEQCPVEQVSWDDALQYAKRLNRMFPGLNATLPTEAQWEYACRAGTETAYCFGDDPAGLEEYAWFHDNSGGKTHEVRQKKANAWGLYDLHGNVWERCRDWFGDYRKEEQRDPAGPENGQYRVLRGASWNTLDRVVLRSADRFDSNGFRCVVAVAVP